MANSLEKASTPGEMAHAMRVSLSMEPGMAKVVGNQLKITEISTLELIKLTKRMAMADMSGPMDASTKEALPMTLSNLSFI